MIVMLNGFEWNTQGTAFLFLLFSVPVRYYGTNDGSSDGEGLFQCFHMKNNVRLLSISAFSQAHTRLIYWQILLKRLIINPPRR